MVFIYLRWVVLGIKLLDDIYEGTNPTGVFQ